MDLDVLKSMIENMSFVKNLGMKVDDFGPRKVVMSIPKHDNVMTPMGMMAAGPIFSLAETAGGAVLSASIDMTKYTLVAKEVTIAFKKPAMTGVRADLSMTEEEARAIMDQVEAAGKIDTTVRIPIIDENGVVVAEVSGIYRVRKMA